MQPNIIAKNDVRTSRVVMLRGGQFWLTFPYSQEMVAALKAAIPLAMWDRTDRVWKVSIGLWREVSSFAKQCNFFIQEEAQDKIAKTKDTQDASRAVSADVQIPAPIGLEYLPFQRAGIAFAIQRPSTLIADEMGLGKTIQAIGVVNMDQTISKVLVVCPASLKLNWQREMKKWLVRPLLAGVAEPNHLPFTDVVIINYDILHKHAEQIRQREWHCLIVDECHYVKNPKTRRSVMLFGGKLKGEAEEIVMSRIEANRRLLLSGTPIVNRPKELFPLLQALDKQAWPSFWKYAHRYCEAQRNRFGFDASGASNLDELQDILRSTLMVRRLKKDVLTELPPKRRQVIELPAGKAMEQVDRENAAYARCQDRLCELRVAVEMAKASENVEDYRQAVTNLRQGASVAFTEMSRERLETALAKVPLVLDHLHDALDEGGHKIVLMAHHKEVIRRIRAEFGNRCVALTGDMAIADRQVSVDRFQKDEHCVLFIGSIMAAGVGITLTAASHVVFAELDWVPGNITQAEDRCHRIGQQDSVFVQHLVLEESLDAKMAHTLIAKQAVIDKALDSDTTGRVVHVGTDAEEPILPQPERERAATQSATRRQIEERSLTLTVEEIGCIHNALEILEARCDGAHSIDGSGFNKLDTRIGKDLAYRASLTPKQAALGLRIVQKYRNQLPPDLRATLSLDAHKEEKEDEPDRIFGETGSGRHSCSVGQEVRTLFDGVGGEFSSSD